MHASTLCSSCHSNCFALFPFAMAPGQRPMQDYLAWKSYGTGPLWAEIARNPGLSCELICQRIHELGGINLSLQSCASIAAAALVAKHSPVGVSQLADADIDDMYKTVKASTCMHMMHACKSGGDHRNGTGAVTTAAIERCSQLLVHCIRRLASNR